MARLHLFTGVDRHLEPGQECTFGRADCCGKEVAAVSRHQFRLACHPAGEGRGVQVTSLSAVNPTKVLLGPGAAAVLLEAGQSRWLAPGNRVLLLACDPSMFVELVSCDSAGGGGGEGAATAAAAEDGAGPRPSKLPRPGNEQQAQQDNHQQHQGSQQEQQEVPSAAAVTATGGPACPVVLVLVGVQGAGKSTFCDALIQQTQQQQGQQQGPPAARWVRINQDSIAGPGRRGTREQCLDVARAALQRGDSCLIDRTNVDQDQRRTFVRLAQQQGAQAHCLVLKLPKKLCMDRAAARAGHEGGLQGKAVYPAVNRMYTDLMEAGDPHPREGFASVLICENDAEVEAALQAWSLFGPAHPDPSAEYARLRPPPPKKPALNTLDRFFAKKPKGEGAGRGEAAGTAAGKGQSPAAGAAGGQRQSPAAVPAGVQQRAPPPPLQPPQQKQQHGEQGEQQSGAGHGSGDGKPGSAGGRPADAFQSMLAAARQQGRQGSALPWKAPSRGAGGGGAGGRGGDRAGGRGGNGGVTGGRGGGGGGGSDGQQLRHTWRAPARVANSLAKIAEHPESRRGEQPHLWYDDRCVLVADKFPKGREHWLVLARDPRLEGPLSLTAGDIPLLEHMVAVARRKVGELRQGDPSLRFRLGFHALPSLRQLHMHVISQDFDSACLKHKKHWNSFTHPSFFLDAAWALAELRQAGRLRYSLAAAEAAEKADLRCHRCGAGLANMPALKAHIASCTAPLPEAAE